MYPQMTKKNKKMAKSHFLPHQALPMSNSVAWQLVYHNLNTKDKIKFYVSWLSAGPWERIAPSKPAKMAKIAENGQDPPLWPLQNVGWHSEVSSILQGSKWYNPLHRYWIVVENWFEEGVAAGAPFRGWHFARSGWGWPCIQNWHSPQKMKIFFELFPCWAGVRFKR